MNYERIYHEFITDRRLREAELRASGEYFEIHHILPRSMGGTNDPSNLIALSAEDHVRAHLLIAGFAPKMWNALLIMLGVRKKFRQVPTKREVRAFGMARRKRAEEMRNNPCMRNPETLAKWKESMLKIRDRRIARLKKHFSDEKVRQRMSESAKAQFSDPVKKARHQASCETESWKKAHSGDNNVMADPEVRAKHKEALADPEYRKKLSIANKGQKRSKDFCERNSFNKTDWRVRKFVHVSGEIFYGTRKEFMDKTKCGAGSVSSLIKGDRAHVKKWGLNAAPDESKLGQKGTNNGNAKKVRCVETGQVFDLLKDAAKFAGLKGTTNISSALSGRCKTAGGYHWEYA